MKSYEKLPKIMINDEKKSEMVKIMKSYKIMKTGLHLPIIRLHP